VKPPQDILALIPARSGSKSIPDKNIRAFAGKPLLAHSIEHARAARCTGRVIVSTDSEAYAEIARSYGAETPFLRPESLARDESTDLAVFLHALDWLRDHEGWQPDIVVHLRPTYPNRDPHDIDRVVEILRRDDSLDSVRTVAPAPATPYKMWTRDAGGLLTPVVDRGDEAYNQPRQALPQVFLQNACIDAVRSRVIVERRSMTGRRIFGYVAEENLDIDTYEDLEAALARMPRDPADGGNRRT
jgi:CMP-N-acetylneuraminic acid synthetase